MGRKKSAVTGRAWHILRLALLWARKGGAFRHKLMIDLRVVPTYLKSLRTSPHTDRIRFSEREFSFDETPAFHFKMHRPASLRHLRIPCIRTPPVDFDDDDNVFFEWQRERDNSLEGETREECDEEEGESSSDGDELSCVDTRDTEEEEEEEEGIDMKAEEFIAQFYEEMKLQRQVSHLQYNEMLQRAA